MSITLTQARLKELLHYDPETGVFTWLVRTSTCIRVGDIAGYRDGDGYLRIGICGGQYRAHRLAWLYMTGKWPIDQIDHKNAVKNDNRWKNLREATCAINNQNKRKALRNNRTGFLGVSRNGKGFIAQIKINEKRRNLGTYPTPELAHEAYLKAKRELHAGCTL